MYMRNNKLRAIFQYGLLVLFTTNLFAQSNQPGTNGVQTYVNPILPGDHPDQTIWKQGNDFYTTGSNFHFAPYLPILHSTDLMHWKVITRVIPTSSSIPSNDATQAGTWQGSIVYFNSKFWVYFSNNNGGGQYFCTATNPAGPWSSPTRVNTNTGVYGYDNSVFIDDDGTPYMLLKNGQDLNGLQKLGMDGQPTGQAQSMNWVNSNGHPYSWAEGPVMCKRNGRYYLFVAGDVSGGQFVLSSAKLSNVESDWTRHGTFWPSSNSSGGFTGPNHITNPVQLADGTWWCLSHAYDNGGWEGQGRQSHLHQINWDANGVPKGVPVNVNPVLGPNLPNTPNYMYEFGKSDYFTSTTISTNWHVFNKANFGKFNLTEKPGYMRLKPGTGTTHILQKDKGRYYSLTTKLDFNATANGQEAGLRIMNGKDAVFFTMYSGYNGGKKIGINFTGGNRTEVNNSIGNVVWLRIERSAHILTCFYSADGTAWTQIGGNVDVSSMDKTQTNYNEWVGTSVGLYATAATADFDMYSHRYGFVPLRVEGRNNWYGATFATKTPGRTVTNGATGDWLAMAGVDLGGENTKTSGIEVNVASASGNASLEVWLDNISGNGTKVATIPIASTGGADTWKNVTASFTASGQHDVFLRWVGGSNSFFVNTIKFLNVVGTPPVVSLTAPANNSTATTLQTVTLTANASDPDGTVSKVDFYDGNTLIGSDNSSPYSASWSGMSAGTHTLTAVATDNIGLSTTYSAVTVTVQGVQAPYNNIVHPIPGIIQTEEYDQGGNGLAYLDNTPGSEVTPVVSFRSNEDVDLEVCTDAGAGYNLGYATAGEWLEYTVNVQTAGNYDLDLRVACSGDGRTVSLSMDDVSIASNVAIPNTTGWQTWTTTSVKNIPLKAGQQIMRLTIGATDYVNINFVEFKSSTITGLQEEAFGRFALYPNPFTNQIYVDLPGIFTYQLMNTAGQIVEEGKSEGKVGVGSNTSKGVYILKITQENKAQMLKVVKD
jgi:beta-xylosidase